MLAGCWAFVAQAMFAHEEAEAVPIDRLIANLERRLVQNTNDPGVLYQLARLHSMRAATLTNRIPVGKLSAEPTFDYPGSDSGIPRWKTAVTNAALRPQVLVHLTNSLAYYDRALKRLPKSTNENDHWLILPASLGYAWTLEQAGRTNLAVEQYRATLKLAWAKEMGVSVRDWIDQLKWSLEARRWLGSPQPGLGPGVCFSQETIRYLLPLLDPVKDAQEFTDLKQRQAKLLSVPRAITPLLMPVTSATELGALVDPHAAVAFDLDGSGLRRRWGWPRANAAWLVWDPHRTGVITSGLHLFGSVTFWVFWRDGYEALAALDDNGDGKLSGAELTGLALWRDQNGNGVSEAGEVVPAAQAGLRELRCQSQVHPTGIPFHPAGAKLENGSEWPTFDWLAPVGNPPPPMPAYGRAFFRDDHLAEHDGSKGVHNAPYARYLLKVAQRKVDAELAK